MSKILFSKVMFALCVFSSQLIEAEPTNRVVNSTSNDSNTIGTLPYWLINANTGDTIDCSPIQEQTITLALSLPAITESYTINGAGITIDGANSYQAFQIASGNITINNITIQNTLSKGGDGGDGYSGGGGAVGAGGALYIHGNTSITLTTSSLLNNSAQGGDGGIANNNGNAGGGGGGGYSGGNGGDCLISVSTGGGGGGHSNGGDGGSNSSVNGSNGVYFGGGGGGAGINVIVAGGIGGNAGTSFGGAESGGNGGGGAGCIENGFSATGAGSSGIPGNGGKGIGTDLLFGCGGGGGCSSETGLPGGAGEGAAGGGGGSNYSGGAGGILGGGGGGGLGGVGGEGGFGSGGGGAATGGLGGGGFSAGGGNGGSDPSSNGGGGGGSGLGGAIFIQSGGQLIIVDAAEISGNTAIAGTGGSSTSTEDPNYVPPGNGAAMGYDIFVREQGSITFDLSNTLTISTPIEGDQTNGPNTLGGLEKLGSGTLNLNGSNTYSGMTHIEEGTLHLDGSLIGSATVEGKLSGRGTLSGNVVVNSGTISPDAGETLTFGSLSLNSESVVHMTIDANSTSLISVEGQASLAGTLEIDLENANLGPYIILTSSTLTGAFDSLQHTGTRLSYTISYLPAGNPTFVQVNVFDPPPEPPSNLQGIQKKNNFEMQYELYNQLTWKLSPSSEVVGYFIYRNGKKISTVSASTYTYQDHNRKKGVSYAYTITAFDSTHKESSPVTIVVSP